MNWSADIPASAWAALLTPVLVAAALRAGRNRVGIDPDGWTQLKPSTVMVLLGFVGLGMAVIISALVLIASRWVLTDNGSAGVALIAGVPLAAFLWYCVYAFLVVGGRFNAQGFEYHGLIRRHFLPWSAIRRIDYGDFWGPYASTERGGFLVSMYCVGFEQFLEEAKRRGIEIDEGIDRARTVGF